MQALPASSPIPLSSAGRPVILGLAELTLETGDGLARAERVSRGRRERVGALG